MVSFDFKKADFRTIFITISLIHISMLIFHVKKSSLMVAVPEKVINLKLQPVNVKEYKKNLKQIVQSEDSRIETINDKKSYYSDKNRMFDRETIARNNQTFQTQSKSSRQKSTQKKNIKLSDLAIAPGDMSLDKLQRSPATDGEAELLDNEDLSKGVSSTNDYVSEVKLGDFTHLNTVEYKHYGFFHRIRQKLEQFWGRSIQEKAAQLFRSGRRLPGNENLITSLQIILNNKGEILKVRILGTSGIKELDDVAIDSFNKAGPFPNPPKDLLVNDIAVLEWGFVVKS